MAFSIKEARTMEDIDYFTGIFCISKETSEFYKGHGLEIITPEPIISKDIEPGMLTKLLDRINSNDYSWTIRDQYIEKKTGRTKLTPLSEEQFQNTWEEVSPLIKTKFLTYLIVRDISGGKFEHARGIYQVSEKSSSGYGGSGIEQRSRSLSPEQNLKPWNLKEWFLGIGQSTGWTRTGRVLYEDKGTLAPLTEKEFNRIKPKLQQ